jgi:hypothetical protein
MGRRREIEAGKPKHSRGKQLWSVLNSSFALWFLSSVVLGGLTAVITTYQKSHSEQMQKTNIQRRLNTEISSRLADGLVALRLDLKRIDNGQMFFASAVFMEAISYLDNRVTYGKKSYDFSIYPEYQHRSFRSLIFELSGVVERSTLPALREAEAAYKQLEDLADRAALGEDHSKLDKSISLGAVKKSMEILDRLQTNSFWRAQL